MHLKMDALTCLWRITKLATAIVEENSKAATIAILKKISEAIGIIRSTKLRLNGLHRLLIPV